MLYESARRKKKLIRKREQNPFAATTKLQQFFFNCHVVKTEPGSVDTGDFLHLRNYDRRRGNNRTEGNLLFIQVRSGAVKRFFD